MPSIAHPDQAHPSGSTLPPVVLDTNVFVAAGFNRSSHAAAIVAAVRRGELQMVWNEATRRETEYILGRIPPLAHFNVADLFRPQTRYDGATHPELFTRIPDPDDRKFIALAHAAGAILVSRDEHLIQPRELVDVTILTAREFQRQYLASRD